MGQPAQRGAEQPQRVGHQPPAVTVLHPGRGDDDLEPPALGVDQHVPLAPLQLFARVIPARPPLCVVLTL